MNFSFYRPTIHNVQKVTANYIRAADITVVELEFANVSDDKVQLAIHFDDNDLAVEFAARFAEAINQAGTPS